MVTLTQLEYIAAVDRLRHFGKAARACHVSQPSLSMQIQKAEDLLGVVIFDRNKKPVLPTEKGVEIIEQAKSILREQARLMQLSKAAAGELSGDFRLGIIPTLSPYLLPLFLEGFAARHPKVHLFIDEMKTEEIVEALRADVLDAALLATPLNEKGLRERVLGYEPFYLYLNADDPLAKRERVTPSQLDKDELWLLQDGHCFRNQVIDYCALRISKEQEPRPGAINFAGGNFETLRNLIRTGHGYTLIPHLFAANLPPAEQRASVRPFAAPVPTREISLVHRREQWKTDIIEALVAAIGDSLPQEIKATPGKGTKVLGITPP